MKLAIPRSVVRVAGSPIVDALARSWRFSTIGEERWQQVLAAGDPYILMLWHEALVPLLWHHRHRQIAIIVSKAREGRYLSDYASRVGYRILSGSSSNGGARALLGAVRALEEGKPVAITPDGPRGPRRQLKPGVMQAAQRSGAWVVPLHARCASAWCLDSWDRLRVPRPRSRIMVGYGKPFRVEPGAAALAESCQQGVAAMQRLESEMGAG